MSIVILDYPRQNLCSEYDPNVLGLEIFVNSAILSAKEYFGLFLLTKLLCTFFF